MDPADQKENYDRERKPHDSKGKKPKELISLDSIDMENTSLVSLMRSTKGGKLTKTEEARQNRKKQRADSGESDEKEPAFDQLVDDTLTKELEDYHADPNASLGPRLVIDADGNMVFDEESFALKTKKRDINALTVVNDTEKKKLIGYGTRASRDKWTKEETELFFKAIRQVGCDFECIRLYFPGKTRLQIKKKFKKEERDHPNKIDFCMKNPLELDLKEWGEVTKQEIPEDFNVEEFEKELQESALNLDTGDGAVEKAGKKGLRSFFNRK